MVSRRFSRRNFLLLGAGAAATAMVGGLLLRHRSVEMTARPTQTVTQPSATLKSGEFADTILVNGNIITVDQADTIVQALAIKDGLILQTGANDEIGALAGAGTRTIDLLGKTVTPGLIDAQSFAGMGHAKQEFQPAASARGANPGRFAVSTFSDRC